MQLLYVGLALVAFCLVGWGLYQQSHAKTEYIITSQPTEPDSVITHPAPAEQSAAERWDSLSSVKP